MHAHTDKGLRTQKGLEDTQTMIEGHINKDQRTQELKDMQTKIQGHTDND